MSKPKETSIIKYFKKSLGIIDFNNIKKEDGWIIVKNDTGTVYVSKAKSNPVICSLLSKYLATSYAYYDKYSNKIYPHFNYTVISYNLYYDSLKYGWRISLMGNFKKDYTYTNWEIGLKSFKKFLRRNKNINLNLLEE